MKNAVIYARYSSHGQDEQTIDGQIRFCKAYAESQGLRVVGVYDGDKAKTASKHIERRKDLQRMMSDAATGAFQYIIVYMFERFARNKFESQLLKRELMQKHGVKVLSATQPISDDDGGELYEMIIEWKDEKYSRDLSTRVKNGLDTSIERGTFCGGFLIYGYKKINTDMVDKKGNFKKRVVVDEEQAAIIRYVFEEYDKGVEKKEIAAALNARGHRLDGKPFTGKSFDRWIVNEKYTGEFYFGERLSDSMYPPIIDKALFERVQKRLEANRYFAGGKATARIPYLLTGKAACAHCETDMVSDGGTSKTGTAYQYYACKKAKKRTCEKKREGKDDLELKVTNTAHDTLSDPKIVEMIITDTLAYQDKRTGADSVKSIDTKIAKAHKEVEELASAFVEAKSGLLRATIEKKMTEYEQLLDDLQTQRGKLEIERGLRITKQDMLDFIAELLMGDPNDKEHQRDIIDRLIVKVFVHDDYIIPFFTFQSSKEVADLRLKEVNKVIEGIFSVQTQSPPLRQAIVIRTTKPIGEAFGFIYCMSYAFFVKGKERHFGSMT